MTTDGLIRRSPYLQWLLVQFFPQLRAWPIQEWPALLAKMKEVELDRYERIGIIAAVVLSAWFLRPAAGSDASIPLVFLSQFVFAVPLLLTLAGPFFLRRIRRGLHKAAKDRQGMKPDSLPGRD